MRSIGLWLTLAAALTPALAAAQPVASGDCQRVRQIERDTPVAGRFRANYRGVLLLRSDDQCGRDYLRLYDLTPTDGAPAGSVAFSLTWYGLLAWNLPNKSCPSPAFFNEGSGSARIWQEVSEKDGLCDLTIYMNIKLKPKDGSDFGSGGDVTHVLQPQGVERFSLGPSSGRGGQTLSFYKY